MSSDPYYPPLSLASTGMKGKCPRCGEGKLFDGFLTTAQKCEVCGLDFQFADAGDGPAWFIMTGVGFVVAAAAVIVEVAYQPSYWVHAALWLPLALALCILPLRPLKGLMIARQYQTGAHEERFS